LAELRFVQIAVILAIAMCESEPSHVHRIGIVDDDEAVRDAIHVLLETRGFLVSEYVSAQDYLHAPQDDCVLLIDLVMADIDGLDLVELLRKGGVQTPIVLMTDIANPSQAARISVADRCALLRKPMRSDLLLEAIAASISLATCALAAT
jgi:two-component system response regulator FixJ